MFNQSEALVDTCMNGNIIRHKLVKGPSYEYHGRRQGPRNDKTQTQLLSIDVQLEK